MMGLMQQMASQVATLGQKVESLESNPTVKLEESEAN